MDNPRVRIILVMVIAFVITQDIRSILQTLPETTATAMTYLSWIRPQSQNQQNLRRKATPTLRKARSAPVNIQDDYSEEDQDEEDRLAFYTPVPTGRSYKSKGDKRSKYRGDEEDKPSKVYRLGLGQFQYDKKEVPNTAKSQQKAVFNKLNEEEREELQALKTHLTKVMQEWCLPKLVCELHASVGQRDVLSDAEKGLLSIIKETSLNPMGEVISRYHFAAHMGQLLADVEGNGCHNFYPNCPLSGTKVLQMVKKVRIR